MNYSNKRETDPTKKAARLTINRLRNAKVKDDAVILHKLQDCHDYDDYNCGSAGCRLCRSKVHHRFRKLMKVLYKRRKNVQLLTIIPEDGWCKYEDIGSFDFLKFLRNERIKLSRIFPKGTTLFGAIDVCLCVFENKVTGEIRKWWQFHLHILTADRPDPDVEQKLRGRYPSSETLGIKRPVRFEMVPISDLGSSSGYTYKEYFTIRSWFSQHGDWSLPSKPWSQRLTPEADVMLHSALGKYSVFDLMFQLGVRRSRSSGIEDFCFYSTQKSCHQS